MAKERKSAPRRKADAERRKRIPAKDGTQRGRVPRLLKDPELKAKICALVRMGATYRDAAGSVGIGESTLYQWLERARTAGTDPVYLEFAEALDRARAEGMSALVAMVHKSARGDPVYDKDGNVIGHVNGDWRAASHLLALRDPENYSLRYRIEHSGTAGAAPIGVQIYMPEEEDEP